ncbi:MULTISPECIES: hypothetical protein [unclassified Arcicella]|uniref:hypothetical protein n=1 Tax=unclassified Arcicella TaxID=2644986 RepID=UPI002866E2F9|nr:MULTISPECIES: hypothetical protein [unclassified Arcicella]MDR6562000.1 hypothetical protein [Arcicella sp. BE51]MDR6811871.1 hypothetical protein [Arcicella sp. BE140]MDR6822901.1 hypothetical protein [Arcicella sp. BE139]
MNNAQKIITLWILFVVCMILHFNYHVGELFYGIEIKRANATGVVPPSAAIIRFIFEILPMSLITFILFIEKPIIRKINFGIAAIFALANLAHLIEEFMSPKLDLSQLNLLSFVFISSLLLTLASWRWLKEDLSA